MFQNDRGNLNLKNVWRYKVTAWNQVELIQRTETETGRIVVVVDLDVCLDVLLRTITVY